LEETVTHNFLGREVGLTLFLICSLEMVVGSLWKDSTYQGRNQERANRAIAPPEIFANMMAFTYFTQSRRHRETLVGLAPPNWNVKHYKWSFC